MTKRSVSTLVLAGGLLLFGLPAPGLAQGQPDCSVKQIAGAWAFATEVGRLVNPNLPPDTEITAIGTMNIGPAGSVDGVFDNNVEGVRANTNVTYSGSVTVRPDCLGELTFVTGGGSMRTDTIAVVSRDEILAMSRNPNVLWTYQVRRISHAPGGVSLAAKVDAIMKRLGLNPPAFE